MQLEPKDSTIFAFRAIFFTFSLKLLNSQNISYLCGLAFGHFLRSKAVLSSYTEYILPTLLNIFHSPRPTLWLLWVMTFYKFYSVPCVEIANNVSLAGTRHVFELPKHTWDFSFCISTFQHFSKSQLFVPIWILIVLKYSIWESSRNKLKNHSVARNCSDLSLFEQIVRVISKILQILGFQPRISKVFLNH